MNDLLWVILLSIAPVSELRGAIIYGSTTELSLMLVVSLAIFFNALVGPLVYLFIHYAVGLFLHIQWFRRFWNHIVVHSQRKLEHSIQKYGTLGMAFFIAVPLPGTGVYTGAIGAYALGFSFRRFFISSIAGVVISGTVVTLLIIFGNGLL